MCNVYSMHWAWCSDRWVVCSLLCLNCTMQGTVVAGQWSVNSVMQCSLQCTAYSLQCTAYSVKCRVYCVKYTAYSVKCTAYSVKCTPYSVKCTASSIQTITLFYSKVLLNFVVSQHLWNALSSFDHYPGSYGHGHTASATQTVVDVMAFVLL